MLFRYLQCKLYTNLLQFNINGMVTKRILPPTSYSSESKCVIVFSVYKQMWAATSLHNEWN